MEARYPKRKNPDPERKSDVVGTVKKFRVEGMVPDDIWEKIFTYLLRDDLDHCELVCIKWRNIIEKSDRCPRRVVSLTYNRILKEDRSLYFEKIEKSVDLKSKTTGKTIRIWDDPKMQELPAFRVFKNIIIDEVVEYTIQDSMSFLKQEWENIFKLAGARVIVKCVKLSFKEEILRDNMILKRIHELFKKYIDPEELTMIVSSDSKDFLCDRKSWEYFNIGKKTKLNIHDDSYRLPKNFPIATFKEFISGIFMYHPNLNELDISRYKVNRDVIVSIVETFYNTTEPEMFFKSIKTKSIENFDTILNKFKFVLDNLDPAKHRLHHPKLKWVLEATQSRYYLTFKSIQLFSN